jgi:CheY-like chemotaxis protein
VLTAGGYSVDAAASAAEAVGLLEEQEYELVLSDLSMESPEAGLKVLAHARMMEYRPATALVRSTYRGSPQSRARGSEGVLIEPEALPELLTKVADMISERATRKLEREMRHSLAN